MASLLFLLLAGTACHAQSDGTGPDSTDAPEEAPSHSLLLGMAFGPSLSLRNPALVPGDPVLLPESSETPGVVGASLSIRLHEALALELGVEGVAAGGHYPVTDAEAPVTIPGYYTTGYEIDDRSLMVAAAGLSYRIPFGSLSIEPAILIGGADVDSTTSYISLKGKGTSEYRTIRHTAGGKDALIVQPALTLRYRFGGGWSRWGMFARASYLHASFELDHTIVETRNELITRSESILIRHPFRKAYFKLGVSYSLF